MLKGNPISRRPDVFQSAQPWRCRKRVDKQVEIVLRAGSELGFSPAARSRIFPFDHKNALVLEAFEPDEGLPLPRPKPPPLPDKE